MRYVNNILTAIHDLLLGWLGVTSPAWGLLIVSAVIGVVLLVLFRYTSNQDAIGRTRDKTTAALLAIWLFKDDLRATLRAQGQLFAYSGKMLVHMIRPLAIMIIPMALFFVQLSLRYEYRPVLPGERLIVSLELREPGDLQTVNMTPEPSDDLRVLAPALRLRNSARVEWAVTADTPGTHELQVQAGDQTLAVPIVASGELQRICWRIPGTGLWDQFLHPGVAPLPDDGPIIGVDIRYPVRTTEILGMDIHWVFSVIIISTVFALLFKPFFKVKL